MNGKLPLPLAAVVLCICTLHAQHSGSLKDRLQQTELSSSLDLQGMPPWHLVMKYDTLDEKGMVTQTGEVEEWWAGPGLHKVAYTSLSSTWVEITNDQGAYRSTGTDVPPQLAELALKQIVHPMPTFQEWQEGIPVQEKNHLGNVKLDCVMLSQQFLGSVLVPFGLFSTYCLGHDQTSLQASSLAGTEVVYRSSTGIFLNKHVPLDQTISRNNIPLLKAHIAKLQTMQISAADFIPGPEMEKADVNPTKIAAETLAGNILTKVPVTYPVSAKARHMSGDVIMQVRVGRDGHIYSLKVLSSPDLDLTIAAVAGARQWVYSPYRVNGQPVEIDSKIVIHFTFG